MRLVRYSVFALSCAMLCFVSGPSFRVHDEKGEKEPAFREVQNFNILLRSWPYRLVDARLYEAAAATPTSPSIDGGSLWSYVGPLDNPGSGGQYNGPSPVSGRVNGIAFAPGDANHVCITSPTGGLHESLDGGTNWNPLSDAWETMNTSGLAFKPNNANTLLVGTGDYHGFLPTGAIGIMKGTFSAGSWTFANKGRAEFMGMAISKIVFDPENPNIVLASAGRGTAGPYGGGRIMRSTDAGDTWAPVVTTARPWNGVVCGAMSPATGRRIYYAAGSGMGNLLLRSVNKGQTWTNVTPPFPSVATRFYHAVDVATSPVEPETVYCMGIADLSAGGVTDHRVYIYRSRNGGNNWTTMVMPGSLAGFPADYNLSQYYYDWFINCGTHTDDTSGLPLDDVYVGLITVAHSADAGATWRDEGHTYNPENIGGTDFYYTHNDQHCLTFLPGLGTEYDSMWIGNDGGVYQTSLNLASSTLSFDASRNRNLCIAEFYHAAWDVQGAQPDTILGGTQDNGSPWSNASPPVWRENRRLGDGVGVVIGRGIANAKNYQYTSRTADTDLHGFNFLSTNNWWTAENNDIAHNAAQSWVQQPPLAGDPNTPNIAYTASTRLWQYDITRPVVTRWGETTGLRALGPVISISVAKGDSLRIYTGAMDGQLWMTTDAGSTNGNWTQIDLAGGPGGNLPSRPISGIAINPSNKNQVWISMQGASTTARVCRCDNVTVAQATRQWVRLGGNGLPDIPVNCVTVDPDNPTQNIFVGTDMGLYYSLNGGASWQHANNITTSPMPYNVRVTEVQVVGTGVDRTLNVSTYGRGIWRVAVVTL